MNVILGASRFSRTSRTVSPKGDSYAQILAVAMMYLTAPRAWSSRVLRTTWIARGVLAGVVFVEAFGVGLMLYHNISCIP